MDLSVVLCYNFVESSGKAELRIEMEHKVLFTASTYSHIANFHRPYLREFRRLGWAVDVACGGAEKEIPEARRLIHIPFEKSMTSPKNLAAAGMLRREICREGYDLISCHTALASFFVRLAVMGLRRRPKVACISHGYLFGDDTPKVRRLLLSGAERLTAPVTDLLMTMNCWDDAYAFEHQLGDQVVKIPGMGVDFSRLRRYSRQEGTFLREYLGFNATDFLLIYPAEFSARKSQKDLILAMQYLPDWVGLLLPGEGTLREPCIKLADSLGLSDRVIFPGYVADMPLWYAAADAAVSSSRSEGLPFNVMEALYFGLPAVVSNVKGHSDLVRDGENGFLFPYGDSRACADKIGWLLQNRLLREQMREAARASVLQYDLSVVLPQVMAHYGSLVPLQEPVTRSSHFAGTNKKGGR